MGFHILGDRDTILGFRFAGVSGSEVETPEQATEAFGRAVSCGQYEILILTESVAHILETDVVRHRLTGKAPYIVEVGDMRGTQVDRKSLAQLIQEAVGIKIVREHAG
jgi:vacuolar-type H+-ATPase subunit F/Vma7